MRPNDHIDEKLTITMGPLTLYLRFSDICSITYIEYSLFIDIAMIYIYVCVCVCVYGGTCWVMVTVEIN